MLELEPRHGEFIAPVLGDLGARQQRGQAMHQAAELELAAQVRFDRIAHAREVAVGGAEHAVEATGRE